MQALIRGRLHDKDLDNLAKKGAVQWEADTWEVGNERSRMARATARGGGLQNKKINQLVGSLNWRAHLSTSWLLKALPRQLPTSSLALATLMGGPYLPASHLQ